MSLSNDSLVRIFDFLVGGSIANLRLRNLTNLRNVLTFARSNTRLYHLLHASLDVIDATDDIPHARKHDLSDIPCRSCRLQSCEKELCYIINSTHTTLRGVHIPRLSINSTATLITLTLFRQLNLKNLSFTDGGVISSHLALVIRSLENLTHLNVNLPSGPLWQALREHPMVTHISLHSISLLETHYPNEYIQDGAANRIQAMKLSFQNPSYNLVNMQLLQVLTVIAENLHSNLPNLGHLDLSCCPGLPMHEDYATEDHPLTCQVWQSPDKHPLRRLVLRTAASVLGSYLGTLMPVFKVGDIQLTVETLEQVVHARPDPQDTMQEIVRALANPNLNMITSTMAFALITPPPQTQIRRDGNLKSLRHITVEFQHFYLNYANDLHWNGFLMTCALKYARQTLKSITIRELPAVPEEREYSVGFLLDLCRMAVNLETVAFEAEYIASSNLVEMVRMFQFFRNVKHVIIYHHVFPPKQTVENYFRTEFLNFLVCMERMARTMASRLTALETISLHSTLEFHDMIPNESCKHVMKHILGALDVLKTCRPDLDDSGFRFQLWDWMQWF